MSSFSGGRLKLKGGFSVQGGKIKKTKKKRKSLTEIKSDDAHQRVETPSGTILPKTAEHEDRRTSTEKKFDVKNIQREIQNVKAQALKSHREKVKEFNEYLAGLTEHHDIPKFAAGFTEDALNQFFGRVQFLFNFATEKFVVIRDWRLGLVLRVLQVAILIYVLYDIINKASYFKQEVPNGVLSTATILQGRERRKTLVAQATEAQNETVPYCALTDNRRGIAYDYEYNSVDYTNFKCIIMDELSIPLPGESKLFITTYFRVDKIIFYDMPENTVSLKKDCPEPKDLADDVPPSTKKLAAVADVCLYNAEEQYFPISPEKVDISITHSYFTSVVGKSGSLPETLVRRKGTSQHAMHAKSGVPLSFVISELLELAGIDLDKRLDEQPNGITPPIASKTNTSEDYPFARLSGVNLIMNFEYYHRALAPGDINKATLPKSDDVICVVEVDPQLTWASAASDVRYEIKSVSEPFFLDIDRVRIPEGGDSSIRGTQLIFERNGVQLTFQIAGNLGVFEFFSLVDALVAGAVLLGVAQAIVTYIALYALGLSSELYMEYMRETVNWRKEYARFAVQSLVAGATFLAFDKNQSGTLERGEIYKYLTETFKEPEEDEHTLRERKEREMKMKEEGEEIVADPEIFAGLSKGKLACLTDFLMRHGEMESEVSRGKLEEVSDVKITTINMAEWVDIFTEEKVKISSLNRLIKNEYKDKKVIKVLLALAEGRTFRELSLEQGEASHLVMQEPASTSSLPLLHEGVSLQPIKPKNPNQGEPSKNNGDPGENI